MQYRQQPLQFLLGYGPGDLVEVIEQGYIFCRIISRDIIQYRGIDNVAETLYPVIRRGTGQSPLLKFSVKIDHHFTG